MSNAKRIFAKMQRTLSDWGQDDFDTLYKGFGFSCTEGSKHRLYFHDTYPELMATVGRHNSLAKGYARHAVTTIERLLELQAEENE